MRINNFYVLLFLILFFPFAFQVNANIHLAPQSELFPENLKVMASEFQSRNAPADNNPDKPSLGNLIIPKEANNFLSEIEEILEDLDRDTKLRNLLKVINQSSEQIRRKVENYIKKKENNQPLSEEEIPNNDEWNRYHLNDLKKSNSNSIPELKEKYHRLKTEMGMTGNTVWYPYGGFDPHTPFWILPTATDVISMGVGRFGSTSDMEIYKEAGYGYYSSILQYEGFDGTQDYHIIPLEIEGEWQARNQNESPAKITGMGFFALLRIKLLLQAKIKGIYYFDVNENGTFNFAGKTAKSCKNAVIEFEVTDSDGNPCIKRYWYTDNNIGDNNPAYEKSCENLKPDLTLIKGAPDMFQERENFGPGMVAKSVKLALGPANRNPNSHVLAEKQLREKGPNPIYRTKPKSREIDFQFGYSRAGDAIYYSKGKDLISSEFKKESIFSWFLKLFHRSG